MRVCLLASGSKGNSLFIETGETKILVDAGLSAREIAFRLETIGVNASELSGILISHEHTDHIRGAGTLARKFKIPVLISYSASHQSHEHFRSVSLVEFETGCSFEFKDILIDPFPITHDSADPVGFVIDSHEARIGFATDLGIVTRLVQEKLKKSRVLVLESNHDENMLLNGPYPWHLKQRIKSRHGHLSNVESAALLMEVMHPGLEGVFLAHLSEANNNPEIALGVHRKQLSGTTVCSPRIFVGNQQSVSEVLSL
ncbi:MAG: MBL fold metallo-hydrolase [Geobacter sp.]|nr:MAG: MBL fold metallo-hydrolase [Geobacter sp.]